MYSDGIITQLCLSICQVVPLILAVLYLWQLYAQGHNYISSLYGLLPCVGVRTKVYVLVWVCLCVWPKNVCLHTHWSKLMLLAHSLYMLPKMFAISNELYSERYSSHFYSFTIVPRWSPRNISNITVKKHPNLKVQWRIQDLKAGGADICTPEKFC